MAPRQFFVDMAHVSEHALLCLGQSPRYNFPQSQAAGFLIPNPKRVVSRTPGIFQRQFETQPSPQWGSVTLLAVGLLVSQDGLAGLQLPGDAAIPRDNFPLPHQVNFVIFRSSKS